MNDTDYTPEALAAQYASLARNNIGNPYPERMQRRLRWAFLKGYRGEPQPVENSNYDKPITRAYRAGRNQHASDVGLTRTPKPTT